MVVERGGGGGGGGGSGAHLNVHAGRVHLAAAVVGRVAVDGARLEIGLAELAERRVGPRDAEAEVARVARAPERERAAVDGGPSEHAGGGGGLRLGREEGEAGEQVAEEEDDEEQLACASEGAGRGVTRGGRW